MEPTITSEQQGTISCHFVRTACDWGRVFIDPAHNTVMCYSSCGSYNFSWHAPGEEFTRFLSGLNFDYAMSKFLGAEKEIDVKGTAEALRYHISQGRRDETYTAEQARQMWDDVKKAQQWRDTEFLDRIGEGAVGQHAPMWYEWICHFHGHQARHFWNLIWRPLMQQLTLVPA